MQGCISMKLFKQLLTNRFTRHQSHFEGHRFKVQDHRQHFCENALLWWRQKAYQRPSILLSLLLQQKLTRKKEVQNTTKISYETDEHLAPGGANITAPTPSQCNTADSPTPFRCLCRWSSTAMAPPAATDINALLCVIGLEKAICRIFTQIKKKWLKILQVLPSKNQTAKHREATAAHPVKQRSKIITFTTLLLRARAVFSCCNHVFSIFRNSAFKAID